MKHSSLCLTYYLRSIKVATTELKSRGKVNLEDWNKFPFELNALDISELATIWNLLAMLPKNSSCFEAVEAFTRLYL